MPLDPDWEVAPDGKIPCWPVTGWQMVTMPTGGMVRLRYAAPDPDGRRNGAPAGLQLVWSPEQMRDFAEGLLRVADRIESRANAQ